MKGGMVSIDCEGKSCSAYLSGPPHGSGPGVVVLQEYWGLVDHIMEVTDRFAAAGFNAIAPDLYHGESTREPEDAGRMMMALNIGETGKELRCVTEWLLEDEKTNSKKLGVVGFCMGGQLSLYAAATNWRIGACVDFYGVHPNVHPPYEQLEAPVLGLFAERDHYTTPEIVRELGELLTRLGKPHMFKTYPGVDHAFFNDHRPEVYNAEASQDAWDRTVDFLLEMLA